MKILNIALNVAISAILTLCLISCGGGGAAAPSVSQGVGASATNLALFSDKVVTKSNNTILMQALLSDGNGNPIQGEKVFFNIVSGNGLLSAPSEKTDSRGIATSLVSAVAAQGIVVVQASHNSLQDTGIVYFIDAVTIQSSLFLSPDANGNGVFGETNDYSIVADGKSTIILKAVSYDIANNTVPGRSVLFGSDSQSVVFEKSTGITGQDGAAYTSFTVSPTVTHKEIITVYATDLTSGATDIISVNIVPITAASIQATVQGSSSIVIGASVNIETCVLSTTGAPMPDGTVIRYSGTPVAMGSVDQMFGTTVNGCSTTSFTANKTLGRVSIVASSDGLSNSLNLMVTKPPQALTVTPANGTALINTSMTLQVSGGTPPYTIISSSATAPVTPQTVNSDGGKFTIKDSIAEPVVATVQDSLGNYAMATIVFSDNTPSLVISPTFGTVATGVSYSFVITGGTPPYKVLLSSSTGSATPSTVAGNGGTFTVTDSVAETVAVTVEDAKMKTTSASLTVGP